MADKLVVGCGYLGRRIAALWCAQNHRVFAMTRSRRGPTSGERATCNRSSVTEFRAGWPQGIAPLGLPRIHTCPFRHTALHIMNTLRDGSLSESALRLVRDAATVVGSCTRLWVSMHPPCVPPTVS